MSYENAQFSSISDLFSKLNTFAVANGWTADYSASDRLFLTRSTCSVAFRWSTVSPTVAAVYQHTAFINSATDPGNHTNDSGQGAISGTNATLVAGRSVDLPNAGGQYWFFESDTYIHVAIEYSASTFVHFGFGILTKVGTWTGGEYSYGWRNTNAGSANTALDVLTSTLLDGLSGLTSAATVRPFVATMHMESMPNQAAGGKWALVWAGGQANTTTDRGGTARANVQGGFRAGPQARTFGRFSGSPQTGLIPMYPITCYYDDPSNARWYYLGYMPDVRGINMKNFSGGDETVVGSDTWVVFPSRYKTAFSGTGSTRNQGIAYRKVTI